jgi:hypothetical protein
MRGICVLGVLAVVACSDDRDATPSAPASDPPASTTAGVTAIDPNATWNIDLENPVDEDADAAFFDVDLWDNRDSGLIGRLHAKGKKVICYFSAGSGEDWRPDYGSISTEALGKGLEGWPGEKWLDTRSEGLRKVLKSRLDMAKTAGCDGVDPDNVDGYANESGRPTSRCSTSSTAT